MLGWEQASGQLAGMQGHAAAVPGGGAANGDAGWSWLDAFEARQKALAAQAAGESPLKSALIKPCAMAPSLSLFLQGRQTQSQGSMTPLDNCAWPRIISRNVWLQWWLCSQ